jgi:hypothetical protein
MDKQQKDHMTLKLQAATLAQKSTPLLVVAGLLQEYVTLTGHLVRHADDLMAKRYEQLSAQVAQPDAQTVREQAQTTANADRGDAPGSPGPGG